jgi:hypothetical protein
MPQIAFYFKAKSEKTHSKEHNRNIDMKSKKCLTINPGFLAAVPLLAFLLAGASTQANGLSVFGSRHVWSTRYLQSHLQHPVTNDLYTPPRSPGWHEEVGN